MISDCIIIKCIFVEILCRPAPKNEDEMMTEIFLYIDRLMSIVRPRRLLYMAIDGVVTNVFFLFSSL